MTSRDFMKLPVLAAALILSVWVFSACSGGSEPQERDFALEIRDGRLDSDSTTFRVDQGDTVRLNLDSDSGGSVHLHGYDIERDVAPGQPSTIEFVADATGRFNFTFHPADEGESEEHSHEEDEEEEEETTLGTIEVHPR